MNHFLAVLKALALGAVCWLACEAALTVHYARQRSVYTFDQVNKVLRETSQTMDEVRKGATAWQSASKDQTSRTTAAMSSVGAAADALTKFISKTDNYVNLSVLPTLTDAINTQNAALLESQHRLQDNLLSLSSATSQAQKVLADADAQIANPAIGKALDNFAVSSQNLATTTADASATMKDVRVAVDKEVNDLLKPVNKVKAAVLFTAQLLGRLYGF